MNNKIKKIINYIYDEFTNQPYVAWTHIITISLVIIPLIIWFSYYIGDNFLIIVNTSLSVGDALGFYGLVLSFVGTTLVSFIAISQNKRLQILEENVFKQANSCNIYISKNDEYIVKTRLSNDIENAYTESDDYIKIYIENYSDPFLTEIEIDFDGKPFKSNLVLTKNIKMGYVINLPDNFDYTKICKIVFTSCYGIKTYGNFEITTENKIKHYHFFGTDQSKIL